MKLHFFRAIILLLTFSLIGNLLKTQTISNLDNKRGFKEFKLGDSYPKWFGEIQLIKDDGLQKQYLYTGSCCTFLFDSPVEKINLIFVHNTLVIIMIELKTWDKPSDGNFSDISHSLKKYDDLNNNFKLLFGSPSNIDTKVNEGKSTYLWETNRTALTTTFNYLGASIGSSADITIADVNYLKENSEKGF